MKRIRQILLNTLGISTGEAHGLVLLILLILASIVIPIFYKSHITSKDFEDLDFEKIDELALQLKESKKDEQTIINDDIVNEFQRAGPTSNTAKSSDEESEKREFKKQAYRYHDTPFDINNADTTILKQVRGIGKVLSNRIVKYRDLLGGFSNKQQLAEVYALSGSVLVGLDTLTFVRDNYQPKKLDINKLSEFELRKHPYIDYKVAKALVRYRFQHKKFNAIDDLYKVKLLDSAQVTKLAPYLNF